MFQGVCTLFSIVISIFLAMDSIKGILLAATTLCLVSCGDVQRSSSDVLSDYWGGEDSPFYYMSELSYTLDDIVRLMQRDIMPDDISEYIDGVIADGEYIPIVSSEDSELIVPSIRSLAKELDDFKDKKRQHFPYENLHQVLNSLVWRVGYMESEGYEIDPRGIIIFPRLLDISACLCPDINLLANHTSVDKRIGVLNLSGFNSAYDFAALIAKSDEGGCRIEFLPQNFSRINKVRYMGESEYCSQYILTLENDEDYDCCLYELPYLFLVDLYADAEASIYDLSCNPDFNNWNEHILKYYNADYKVYFDPKRICWSWCRVNEFGNLEKIEGTKSLYLDARSRRLWME